MRHLVKSGIQQSIRSVHAMLLDRGLPDKVGIYLHSLETSTYPAFREMVSFFRKQGYRFTSPDDFLVLPHEKAVFISFDDSYRTWYHALPLYKELDISVTFYVNTRYFRDQATPQEIEAYFDRLDFEGTRITLSIPELLALDAAGHTIGAHTHTHPSLTALPLEEAQQEIRQSKEELEAILGKAVRHFSYPFGMRRYFNETLRAYCKEIGFATIANAIPALQHAGQSSDHLHRSVWHLDRSVSHNVMNIRIDGSFFENLTGRSAIG